MNKKIFGFALVFMFLVVLATPLTSTVLAKKATGTDMGDYTEYVGILGGADYIIYMPKSWNGRLIMGCHGYNAMGDPHPELLFDAVAKELASAGYAFAASNYNGGERAYLVKEGIIRIHQLTEYIVDNYHVTDKIFVIGASMGGQIALNLARKYPNLYSGVLDICGLKDMFAHYEYDQIWITKPVNEIRALFGIPATVPDETIMFLKMFVAQVEADTIEAYGGTPIEKPKAYERYDPVFNAELRIPTISLLGGIDVLVPMFCHLDFEAAVAAAGSSDLYRMHIVPMGGHCDGPIQAERYAAIMELMAWSDSLD
jgi:pimeloyl-ACP methyl ester carboxylesterase